MKVYIDRIETMEYPLEIWYGTDKDKLDFHYIMYDLRFEQCTNACSFTNHAEPNHWELDENQNLLLDSIIKQIAFPFVRNEIKINIGMNEFDIPIEGYTKHI